MRACLFQPSATLPNQVNPKVPLLRMTWQQAMQLSVFFAAISLIIQTVGSLLGQHFGYGLFGDELYYVMCGRHLAWGYVDLAPMAALQAHVSEALFGLKNQALFRIFSALAGSARVSITGVLVWLFGGRKMAQVLAMIAVLVAPVYLALDSVLAMNSFESMFWMSCLLAIIWMVRGGSLRWWIAFGVSGGLGLLNKPSMAFFLFGVLGGLLLTPERRLLRSRWALIAVALIVGIAMPFMAWQANRHWPMWELLYKINHDNLNGNLGPLAFLQEQITMFNPVSIFLTLPGLIWLLTEKSVCRFRWIGIMFLGMLVVMMRAHALNYYVAPVYPVLFAAGAVALQEWLSASRKTAWLLPALGSVVAVWGAITLPLVVPVLPPYTTVHYFAKIMYLIPKSDLPDASPLLPILSDRLGWHHFVADVATVYASLSPQERAETGIYCDNYGEASAINIYGPRYGLPTAVSGHQNYFYWGSNGYTGQVLIVIGGSKQDLQKRFASVEKIERVYNPLANHFSNRPIYLCRGEKIPLNVYWPHVKNWY